MAADGDRSRSDHYLSERVTIRFTPNEMEYIRAVARGMNPPVTEAYVVRACVVGWRQITTSPLLDNLKPLDMPLDGRRKAPTTVHKPRRARAE